jgi:hypothetical protein
MATELMQLLPRDEFDDVLTAFDVMVSSLAGHTTPTTRFFEREHGETWKELVSGGWHEVGRAEGGASSLELAHCARIWGRYLIPLPFVETSLVHRWFPEVRGDADLASAALTFAIGRADASEVIVPYLDRPEVVLVGLAPNSIATVARENPSSPPELLIASSLAPSMPVAKFSKSGNLQSILTTQRETEYVALLAAQAVGAAEVAFESTVQYAKDREQFGQAIANFQAVQHRLANMWRDLQLAQTALICATQDSRQAHGAAHVIVSLTRNVCEGAIQLHGGIGYTWELGLHYYLRHVLAIGWVVTHMSGDPFTPASASLTPQASAG